MVYLQTTEFFTSASVSQLDRQYLVVAEEPNLWMETKYFSGNLKLILTKFIVISTFLLDLY